MIKAPRGTRDLLPPDTALWNHVESVVRDVFRAYNFQEIRTPIFESTELFARGVGEETDIVSKEMFTWEDGASSADRAILAAWQSLHTTELEAVIEPQPPPQVHQTSRFGPSLQVKVKGSWTLVRARYAPTHQDLRQFEQSGRSWQAMRQGKEARLVLATLKGSVLESFVLAARMMGIEVEELDVPRFESPQLLTLRPENTAGVVRAYIQHDLGKRGLNKLFYIGPQFRRERPQKGRYRQFYQIGAEVIGPASAGSERPLRDAEVLEMLDTLLRRLGIQDFALYINSVGDPKDRATYNDALRSALEPVVANMCEDCQRRAVTNPLRVFDCKVPRDQPIIQTLPLIRSYLSEGSNEHFENVQALLRKAGVHFEVNPRLVRGLDYYTRTAFEFTHGALGAQNAIVGGGRYDGLAELLGSPEPAPGIGFAIGEDRLVMTLQGRASETMRKPDAYIAPVGEGMNRNALLLARDLRREGLTIELGDRSFRLKKMFEIATKAGAKYILIVGENEIKADAFALKNLATGEQISVPRADLAEKILPQEIKE
jgi:histidyl-tRNA synthetase